MIAFLKRKLAVMRQPLMELNLWQRLFLKLFLLCFGHLITIENTNRKGAGNETITGPDPCIFAFNHNCFFESVLVPSFLTWRRQGRKINFISDWMYQHFPIVGWVLKQTDPIYSYHKPARLKFLNRYRPKTGQRTVYQECIDRLKRGNCIGIFPEGTRNFNPVSLLKGQKGIGYIVLNTSAPVVPGGIDFPLRRNRGKIPKLGAMILRWGDPMKFNQERFLFRVISTVPDLEPRERQLIIHYLASKITYQIMIELANLSGKNYPFPEPAPPVLMERFFIKQACV